MTYSDFLKLLAAAGKSPLYPNALYLARYKDVKPTVANLLKYYPQ